MNGSRMLSSLPRYPMGPEPKLPPPRKDWSTIFWVGFVLLVGAGVAWFLNWIASGLWVFAFAPEILTCSGVGLAGSVLAIVFLFVYLGQRSERQDK